MKAIDAVYFQEFINQYRIKQEERANKGLGLEYFGPKEMQMLLDKMPTFETEPVRHGCNCKVITHPYADDYSIEVDSKRSELSIWEGHVCLGVFHADYCPNCGAKMDLEESHNGKN